MHQHELALQAFKLPIVFLGHDLAKYQKYKRFYTIYSAPKRVKLLHLLWG